MILEMDTEEVFDAVVDGDAVEVVDLVIERDAFPGPGEKDGTGDEDTIIFAPCVFKMPIPLFTIRVRRVCAVRPCCGVGIYKGLLSVRCDTDAAHFAVDTAVMGNIETIPVVGEVGHEVQRCTFVQDSWINNLIHSTA